MLFSPSFWMVLISYLGILDFWHVGNWQGGITLGDHCGGCRETWQGGSLQRFLPEGFIQKRWRDQSHRETFWHLCTYTSGLFSLLPLLPHPSSAIPSLPSLLFPYNFSHSFPQLSPGSVQILSLPLSPLWMCSSSSLSGNKWLMLHLQMGLYLPLDFNQG